LPYGLENSRDVVSMNPKSINPNYVNERTYDSWAVEIHKTLPKNKRYEPLIKVFGINPVRTIRNKRHYYAASPFTKIGDEMEQSGQCIHKKRLVAKKCLNRLFSQKQFERVFTQKVLTQVKCKAPPFG
jgi:hypothetical protein